jgi:multiple antibiotic resistance protein
MSMLPSMDVIINALVTLFVTIDPVGNAPIFLGLTAGMSTLARRSVAIRGAVVAFLILALFAVTGTGILDAMGITVDAFRVAGGLLLFYTAFEMLYAKRQERKAQVSESALREHIANIAVFPLAIPLLAGPGTISATIILSSQLTAGNHYWVGTGVLLGLIFALMLLTAVVLLAAEVLDKYIGDTGKMIFTRLLGVLLAALSVQYVADGVRGLVAS